MQIHAGTVIVLLSAHFNLDPSPSQQKKIVEEKSINSVSPCLTP